MRSVLITGTSTGIGLATAVTLAARRWRVFATMRNLEKRGLLEQAAKEAGVQDNVEIEQLDLTCAASIRSAVASTLSQTGNKLDAVVHNAGVAAAGAMEDLPEIGVAAGDGDELLWRARADARSAADLPCAKARTHRHRLERSRFHGPTHEFDLLRLEMGGRRMGRGNRLRARAVRNRHHPCRTRPLSH